MCVVLDRNPDTLLGDDFWFEQDRANLSHYRKLLKDLEHDSFWRKHVEMLIDDLEKRWPQLRPAA